MKIEEEKIKSRENCPCNMKCQCFTDKNWDGFCKMYKRNIYEEKALELVFKFANICNSYGIIVWYNAKICALIAVDEIISIKLLWFQKNTKDLDYWNEVKKEINKL